MRNTELPSAATPCLESPSTAEPNQFSHHSVTYREGDTRQVPVGKEREESQNWEEWDRRLSHWGQLGNLASFWACQLKSAKKIT